MTDRTTLPPIDQLKALLAAIREDEAAFRWAEAIFDGDAERAARDAKAKLYGHGMRLEQVIAEMKESP